MKLSSLILGFLLAASIFWSGCSNSEETSVDCSASQLRLSITAQTDADCSDPGSITVQAFGGTPPYLYSVDRINWQGSGTLNNLFAGSYIITARDTNGCMTDLDVELGGTDTSISLALNFTSPDCDLPNGTITASATRGTEPYMYSLNGGTQQASNVFSEVSNGPNTVSVTDSEGCHSERDVVVVSKVSFAADVFPLILTNCAVTGCHDGSRSPDLRESVDIMTAADRIKVRITERTMPPGDRPSLEQSEIDVIVCWIDDGIPDN